jgi:hypothetical protein
MYDLTVDEAHTFFVGDGQWLVHNTQSCIPSLDDLANSAAQPDRGGYTNAGRSLTKHGSGARATNQLFPQAKGNPATVNAQAQELVESILTDPGTIVKSNFRPSFGNTTIHSAKWTRTRV